MGTPIALVGVIIMAINTGTVSGTGLGSGKGKGTGLGKEYTSNQLSSIGSNSDYDTTISLFQAVIKISTNIRKDKDEDKNKNKDKDENSYKMSDFRIIQNTDSNISISIKKENEQYIDQSMAEMGRSRRHLGGLFHFSKSTFRAGKEIAVVV